MQVRRRVTYKIDAHERVGERLRVDGHLSRIGLQTYSDGYDGQQVEYRPPEEVFSDASLQSLRGMPVTIRHPQTFVTPDNWKVLAVGSVGDVVVKSTDGRHVSAPVWLHDAQAIRAVESGDLEELSVGYTARVDPTPGTYEGAHYDAVQRDIRGNHLALLGPGEARGGPTCALRLDASGHEIIPKADQISIPRLDGGHTTEGLMAQTIRVGELDFEVEAPPNFLNALEHERTQHADALKVKADATTTVETELVELKTKVEGLEADLVTANDPKRIDARVKLIEDARRLGGKELDVTGTALEIKRRALETLEVKDIDDADVNGAFTSELRHITDTVDNERQDSVRNARRSVAGPPVDEVEYHLDDQREV